MVNSDTEISKYALGYDGSTYYSTIAHISRPKGKSYWATYITLYPGEDLADKIEDWSDKEKASVIRA